MRYGSTGLRAWEGDKVRMSPPVGRGGWGRWAFKDRASEQLGCCCPEHPLCPHPLWVWRWGFEGCPTSGNRSAFIPQGKMSQNFRASYTETLGKLETQYCKLMVSGSVCISSNA